MKDHANDATPTREQIPSQDFIHQGSSTTQTPCMPCQAYVLLHALNFSPPAPPSDNTPSDNHLFASRAFGGGFGHVARA